jgi:hypothetical protein
MSHENDESIRFYQFGFTHRGEWGLVSVYPCGARVHLRNQSWTADECPNPVALSVLKARIAAARERTHSAYPHGTVEQLQTEVSRETLQSIPPRFVQVAESFDASRLSLVEDAEHTFAARR